MQAFEVRSERTDQDVRVCVVGEVDLATAPRIAACLSAHAPGRGGSIELNLSGVDFMDSTGAHLLMKLQDEARREGWTLTIVPSPAVRRVLSTLGLHDQLLVGPAPAIEEVSAAP